ncbi:MAG: DUF4407 domain-containing protein [Azoarcus sp.]|jgi:hypothetical protein|nr:DUF4407 domain-containing protein [Azoarcus sp.]
MLSRLKSFVQFFLLFFYGTTPSAINHHTPQARIVAYTLGGIIAFVTLPFVFVATLVLASTHITPDVIAGSSRWAAILALSMLLTFAIVWLERALVILGDAVAPHWAPQLCLLVIRLMMIVLLSVVIAQKWEEASHQGLIRAERQVMRDEAVEQHRQYADKEFDVSGLNGRESSAQETIRQLELQLGALPAELVQAQARDQSCQVESQRLRAELSSASRAEDLSETHQAYLNRLRTRAQVKAAECRQMGNNTRKRIDAYKAPIRTRLDQEKTEHTQLKAKHSLAEEKADQSYEARMSVAEQALKEAGTDAKAFARIRQKHPEIDLAVKEKTLLLAMIELLPLLLKLLLWNSPISAEARATLQIHSAWYRIQTRQSLHREKAGFGFLGSGFGWDATASMAGSPYHAAPPFWKGSRS